MPSSRILWSRATVPESVGIARRREQGAKVAPLLRSCSDPRACSRGATARKAYYSSETACALDGTPRAGDAGCQKRSSWASKSSVSPTTTSRATDHLARVTKRTQSDDSRGDKRAVRPCGGREVPRRFRAPGRARLGNRPREARTQPVSARRHASAGEMRAGLRRTSCGTPEKSAPRC